MPERIHFLKISLTGVCPQKDENKLVFPSNSLGLFSFRRGVSAPQSLRPWAGMRGRWAVGGWAWILQEGPPQAEVSETLPDPAPPSLAPARGCCMWLRKGHVGHWCHFWEGRDGWSRLPRVSLPPPQTGPLLSSFSLLGGRVRKEKDSILCLMDRNPSSPLTVQ